MKCDSRKSKPEIFYFLIADITWASRVSGMGNLDFYFILLPRRSSRTIQLHMPKYLNKNDRYLAIRDCDLFIKKQSHHRMMLFALVFCFITLATHPIIPFDNCGEFHSLMKWNLFRLRSFKSRLSDNSSFWLAKCIFYDIMQIKFNIILLWCAFT